MTDQPQRAITPYRQLKELMTRDEIKLRFSEILGQRAGAFMASVLNTVYLDNNLQECDPNSIIISAMTAAALDLPVDKNIGQAWIIPYGDGNGSKKASFQMGYKGYIQLALRTGQYVDLNVTEIYEGEEVKVDRLTGRIVLNGKRTGSNVVGYVTYFRLLNGFEKYYYMSREDVVKHAEKYSKGYHSNSSKNPWKSAFDEMAKKTCISACLRKYGLMSVQMQSAIRKSDPEIIGMDEAFPPAAPAQVIDHAPAFDPAAVLVEEGISENLFAANGLLAKTPAEVKTNREALVAWGKLYRAWRHAGEEPDAAAEHASNGEQPDKLL
jgi:recombination protein RecT